MATIVYQGLQSCLDSQLVEPRALRLALSSSITPHFSQPLDLSSLKTRFPDSKTNEPLEKCHYGDFSKEQPSHLHENERAKNSEMGGGSSSSWSFLQALSNCSHQGSKLEKENTYVHPSVKRSSSALSEKSLKLCTENLGNETGTDIAESGIFSNTSVAESKGGNNLPKQCLSTSKTKSFSPSSSSSSSSSSGRSFPPPLTTMSGAESLQFRPHREEGRLIIKAVKTPSRGSCFRAERSNGRLRLCFLENYAPTFDLEENEGRIINYDDNENEGCENDCKQEQVIKLGTEEAKEEEEEEGDGEACWEEDKDEKEMEVGGEIGIMENIGRTTTTSIRRCKEGGEHEKKTSMLNLKPFWVATS